MTINNCKIIDLPKIQNTGGNLTFVKSGSHIPFETQRVDLLFV
jgi:hypothetical protein